MLPKLLFYATADQVEAYHWKRGVLTPGPVLRAEAADFDILGQYLDQHPGTPAYVIADVVEEDYQRQLLPHVRGRAGRTMVERRLVQMYRDTPFVHAALQERDEEGRRDDHALFSALTNAAQLQSWMDVFEQRETPLAGVYSAAWLSTLLVRRLAVAQDHLLLITEQAGGLRQSYFQGPYLKFSRLTVLSHGEEIDAATAAETARMHQFLTSTRLLARGAMLQVAVLAPSGRLAKLEAQCVDEPETSFHFIDMETAADRFKLDEVPETAERLLLELVANGAPPSQYALPSPRRFYRIWQGRIGLNALTAMVATVAALWLLSDAWSIVDARASTTRLLQEAARADTQYRAAMANFPASSVKSANMKAAVQLDVQLTAQAPSPEQMAALASRALEAAPAIRLSSLDWQADRQPAANPGGELDKLAGTNEAARPITASLLGLAAPPVQTMRIEGEIDVAQSDYRAIVDSVNQFAFEMSRNPGVTVEILESPIDVRQNVTLTGRSGGYDSGTKPKFVLKVTWQP